MYVILFFVFRYFTVCNLRNKRKLYEIFYVYCQVTSPCLRENSVTSRPEAKLNYPCIVQRNPKQSFSTLRKYFLFLYPIRPISLVYWKKSSFCIIDKELGQGEKWHDIFKWVEETSYIYINTTWLSWI